MKCFFVFIFLGITICSSFLKAESTSRVTTISLARINHDSSSLSESLSSTPIKTSFLVLLLNLLAMDGYDNLINLDHDVLQSAIKKTTSSNGSNCYEVVEDNILDDIAFVNLESDDPYLKNLLEKNDNNSKSKKYLAIKIGVINKLPSGMTPNNLMKSLISSEEASVEYYVVPKSSFDSASDFLEGELWIVFSSEKAMGSTLIQDEATLLRNVPSLEKDSLMEKESILSSPESKNYLTRIKFWSNYTPEQQEAFIKVGVFTVGCAAICFFPELSLLDRVLVVVCLPCFAELGENIFTVSNAIFNFS